MIIPHLPEKRNEKTLFRFDAEFVEERRRALQTFVYNICIHPQLRDAPELVAFCSSSSANLHSSEPLHDALGGRAPSLSSSALAKAQAADPSLEPETEKYEAMERYVDQLEEQLQQLQQMAQRISDRRLKMYDFIKSLGPIFSSLARDDASLGAALSAVSQKCEAITSMYKSQSATDENRITVPLHMYKCLCAAARSALRRRESSLQLLCESLLENEDLTRKLAAMKAAQADPAKRSLFQKMGGGGDAVEQIAKHEAKVSAAMDLLIKRREVYADACSSIQEDAARLHSLQLQDFKTMMLGFACRQGEFHKGVMETWASVLPVVEAAAAKADNDA